MSHAFNLMAGGGVILIAPDLVVMRYGREAEMAAVAADEADEELVGFPVEPAPVGWA